MLRRLMLVATALTLLAGLTACNTVAPERTLPNWVRGIYVPMLENESFEPGLEELATGAIREAFVSDGRVDIVPREHADLVLKGRILDLSRRVTDTSDEEIAVGNDVTMLVALQLFEPLNMETPLADLGVLKVRSGFYEDVRSVDYTPEPRRKQDMMNLLGVLTVNSVINGFPAALQTTPPGATLPKVGDPSLVDPDAPLRPRNEAESNQ